MLFQLVTHAMFGTSTRELAYQIAEQFRVLGKPLGLRDCIIVGGMGKTLHTCVLTARNSLLFRLDTCRFSYSSVKSL